jgi:hypothetical protein
MSILQKSSLEFRLQAGGLPNAKDRVRGPKDWSDPRERGTPNGQNELRNRMTIDEG